MAPVGQPDPWAGETLEEAQPDPRSAPATGDRQAKFQFAAEILPPLTSYTQTPNELLNFQQAYPDQGRATLFLNWFIQQTYGGRWDLTHSNRARGRRLKRLPLTMAQIAGVMLLSSRDGAAKIVSFLIKEAKVLIRQRVSGEDYYWLDYQRFSELKAALPRECPQPKRPGPSESNIPHDSPVGQTTDSTSHCLQDVDSIESKIDRQALKCVLPMSDNGGVPPETLVVLPGSGAPPPSPIGIEIARIRVRDSYGSIISEAHSRGRITAMEIAGDVLNFTTDAQSQSLDSAGKPGHVSLAELTAWLNALVGPKLGSVIPSDIAKHVHKYINTEAGLQALDARVRTRWKAITSWKLFYHAGDRRKKTSPHGLAIDAAALLSAIEAPQSQQQPRTGRDWTQEQERELQEWISQKMAEQKQKEEGIE